MRRSSHEPVGERHTEQWPRLLVLLCRVWLGFGASASIYISIFEAEKGEVSTNLILIVVELISLHHGQRLPKSTLRGAQMTFKRLPSSLNLWRLCSWVPTYNFLSHATHPAKPASNWTPYLTSPYPGNPALDFWHSTFDQATAKRIFACFVQIEGLQRTSIGTSIAPPTRQVYSTCH